MICLEALQNSYKVGILTGQLVKMKFREVKKQAPSHAATVSIPESSKSAVETAVPGRKCLTIISQKSNELPGLVS